MIDLNNLKSGLKLIKYIMERNKSDRTPWHKNNQTNTKQYKPEPKK